MSSFSSEFDPRKGTQSLVTAIIYSWCWLLIPVRLMCRRNPSVESYRTWTGIQGLRCLASERGGVMKVEKKHCLRYIKTSLVEAEGYLNSRDRKDGFVAQHWPQPHAVTSLCTWIWLWSLWAPRACLGCLVNNNCKNVARRLFSKC